MYRPREASGIPILDLGVAFFFAMILGSVSSLSDEEGEEEALVVVRESESPLGVVVLVVEEFSEARCLTYRRDINACISHPALLT